MEIFSKLVVTHIQNSRCILNLLGSIFNLLCGLIKVFKGYIQFILGLFLGLKYFIWYLKELVRLYWPLKYIIPPNFIDFGLLETVLDMTSWNSRFLESNFSNFLSPKIFFFKKSLLSVVENFKTNKMMKTIFNLVFASFQVKVSTKWCKIHWDFWISVIFFEKNLALFIK